jgi:hypothetical protein
VGSGARPDSSQCGEGGEQGGESIRGEVTESGFGIRPSGNEPGNPGNRGHSGRGFQRQPDDSGKNKET